MLSYKLDGDPTVRTWIPGQKPPERLIAAIEKREPMRAHNAQFERLAMKWLSKYHGWPAIRDEQWHCTAAQAAALALPRSLEGVCNAMNLPEHKDTQGKRLINKFCRPQPRTGARVMPADDPDDFALFIAYNKQDVRAECAVHEYLPRLPQSEEAVWQLDTKINARGLPIDRELILAMKDVSGELQEELLKRVTKLTRSVDAPDGLSPGQVQKLRNWCEQKGVNLPNLQANTIAKALEDRYLPDDVRDVLLSRVEAGRVSIKKLDAALVCAGTDDRVRGTLLYHGATPGRWAGKLLQPQNFPRGTLNPPSMEVVIDLVLKRDIGGLLLLFNNPMEALSSVMRSIITAINGRVLSIQDYKAIEARVLAWIAGQMDVLALYHKGADLYVYMATKIYELPVSQIDSTKRKFGKDTVLGCGYQMGVDKFILTGAKRNLVIPRDLAEACVYGYRDTMKNIVAAWGNVERASIRAVVTGKPQHVCKCIWYTEGRFLYCQLPSGRKLAYPDPEVHTEKVRGREKQVLTFMVQPKKGMWVRQGSYGGLLVENTVQGISRDIMVNGMMNADKAGLEIIGTVHDEVIVEKDADLDDRLSYHMSRLPPWAAGCPIETEGFVAKRYRKG